MNVSESCNVNFLLEWLLDPTVKSEAEARRAAVELAERAYQRLAAGLTPDQVLERWPGRPHADALPAAAETVLERDDTEVDTAPVAPVRGKQARFRRAGAPRLRPLGETE